MGFTKRLLEEQEEWADVSAGECLRCGGEFQLDRDNLADAFESYGLSSSIVRPLVESVKLSGSALLSAVQSATGEARSTIEEAAISSTDSRLCSYCTHMTSKND